jgi:dihydrofolate reductase
MTKIFLHIMVSLDGYIEGPDQELDWHFVDKEFEDYSNEMLRSISAIMLGRNVYEVFLNYWPHAFENPAMAPDPSDPSRHLEAARLLHELPKYIVSTTLKTTGWHNTHLIGNNLREEVIKLKQKPGKDIALFGGATLASSLIEMNLIDEYRLIVNPVILGDGTQLFRKGLPKTEFTLTGSRKFKSGAMLLKYSGPLPSKRIKRDITRSG